MLNHHCTSISTAFSPVFSPKHLTLISPANNTRLICLSSPFPVAGLESFWVSSSGWTDVSITNLETNVTAAAVASRTSCPGFFCASDQRSAGGFVVSGGGKYLLEVVHQHWQGPSHLLLAAVGADQTG